ncbi:MAG: multidrug transporter [Thermodesulfobacteriota bacterium]
MKKIMFFLLISAVAAGLLGSPALAYDVDADNTSKDGAAMAVDVFAARPLGFASTVLGSATFVVSLPFSALGGNVGPAYDRLVILPARYTFDRPLGAFD